MRPSNADRLSWPRWEEESNAPLFLFDWIFFDLTGVSVCQEEEQRLTELSQQKKQGLSLGSIASRFWRSKQQ